MVRVIDISITVTQVSTQCPYLIRVIDVSITVTQVSTQCPYLIRVIDIRITVTQVSTQCLYPISHRRKYYSHPSQYTMTLPNKSHRRK
jgi:hypothetical protein